MARAGTRKVRGGRVVPKKGCRFVKGGGGRVTCKGGKSAKRRSRRRRSRR